MMSFDNQRKTANAISGKTARACDSCLWKRARWFCVADDAFLCQSCDDESPPAWHRGFTRKPRTPQNAKRTKKQNSGAGGVAAEESVNPLLPLVPEMGSDDDYNNNEIDPEQLFCQVPVLLDDDLNALLNDSGGDDHMRGLEIPEFLSSDMELAEFAADVETLRRRERSTGESVQGEEEDEVVLEEDSVRGEEIECREEASFERAVCEEGIIVSTTAAFPQLPPQSTFMS
nr:zinc finger protein CONSTANS-LIKE 16 [Ipomoea batatas]